MCQDIIFQFNRHATKSIISKLQDYPRLQRKFIETMLTERNAERIPEDILITYIKLLCTENLHDKVVSELRNRIYPIDKCLKLCKVYNVTEGRAYLYERTGHFKKAIEMLVLALV